MVHDYLVYIINNFSAHLNNPQEPSRLEHFEKGSVNEIRLSWFSLFFDALSSVTLLYLLLQKEEELLMVYFRSLNLNGPTNVSIRNCGEDFYFLAFVQDVSFRIANCEHFECLRRDVAMRSFLRPLMRWKHNTTTTQHKSPKTPTQHNSPKAPTWRLIFSASFLVPWKKERNLG